MAITQQLKQALDNLDSIPKRVAPKAAAMAANRVATKASGRAIRATAKDGRVRVPAKVIRPRVKVFKASEKSPTAIIRVRRRPIPLIRVGAVQQRMIRYRHTSFTGIGDLQVGRHRVPGGFMADGSRGVGEYRKGAGYAKTTLRSWQIMRRVGRGRYDLEVMRIPILAPITEHYDRESRSALSRDMPRELQQALLRQLQLIIK